MTGAGAAGVLATIAKGRRHRSVIGSDLAQLARGRGGRLATLDRDLAPAHGDVVDLVGV